MMLLMYIVNQRYELIDPSTRSIANENITEIQAFGLITRLVEGRGHSWDPISDGMDAAV